jgi:light-regulated signal transduction histidine kinase (bacteriophytochrome)
MPPLDPAGSQAVWTPTVKRSTSPWSSVNAVLARELGEETDQDMPSLASERC